MDYLNYVIYYGCIILGCIWFVILFFLFYVMYIKNKHEREINEKMKDLLKDIKEERKVE